MKNLSVYVLMALVAVAAFGQTVTCDDCTHVVPVYMGEGGFIATADDADEVTYVATCGGVTRAGELEANDDGVVSMLFMCDNDDLEENQLQLGPVMDGGWFWITGEKSSAVGGIVAMDVLDNDKADITGAGDGVMMDEGQGAVYLHETSTGRTGVLSNILPEPPAEAAKKCGFSGGGTGTNPFAPVKMGCMLGDGKTMLLATITDGYTDTLRTVANKSMVMRPSGSGHVDVVVDLWGNGSGHYVTTHATAGNGISAVRGQPALAKTAGRAAARLDGITYTVTRGSGEPGSSFTLDASEDLTDTPTPDGATEPVAADDGLARSAAANDVVTIRITADSDYCSKDNNYTANVTVNAVVATITGTTDQVVPTIVKANGKAVADGDVVASTTFAVVCRSGAGASAQKGQDLVPPNLFPAN